jgi:hypothetical protein
MRTVANQCTTGNEHSICMDGNIQTIRELMTDLSRKGHYKTPVAIFTNKWYPNDILFMPLMDSNFSLWLV